MMRIIQWLAALLLLSFGCTVLAAELHDPDPVAVPEQMASADVVKSIKNALIKTRWAMDAEAPGRIMASYSTNGHVAKVAITYDDKQVRVVYADSISLDYQEDAGRREIHHNYNKWVESLARQIAQFDPSGDPDVTLKAGAKIGMNPPPDEKFSSFGHFDITPITMDPPYAGQQPNEEARAKIQECLDNDMTVLLGQWNKAATADKTRTLRIEPHIESIKFIGGGARFFVGAMAGSSSVAMRVRYTDADSGKVIANPRFFLHPGATAGFMGTADNHMLKDAAQLVRDYTAANYEEAVGGSAGDTR